MSVNTFSYNFSIPPATDIEALMAFVAKLLGAHQVKNTITSLSNTELDHPIPESKQLLMQEAYRLNEYIGALKSQWANVEVEDARMAGLSVMIVFKVSGDRTNEFISIS
ncbi:hypothetical protein HWC35_gp134 [Vibrio phage USC-1]|uniref:Uncharacterized protein n=2 Tax=Aphroditevirus USC1 TaxID=2846605 RepID=A0A514A2L5_9CAUD|nr:hypothetical protein HWC35_gp134 [Vibrio phage USC-1]QCW23200.1 hypothetical protein [Vibrio phage 5 TSL-2019]QDH47528.1 hypothetical protein [Vibrio phage USC-1]